MIKPLSKYIFENKQINKIVSTSSNSERRKLLKDYLEGEYDDYLDKLDNMCKDPKAQSLLDDAFGGELGDVKLDFSVENIAVRRLVPTQIEIGLEASLKYLFTKPETIDTCFKDKVEIYQPIITFNRNYVIDGHHRWSQIFCANPEAKAVCVNYDGDLTEIEMLKVTQGAIAAAVDEVPKSTPKGANMYQISVDEIKKYISDNITDETVDTLKKYVKSIKDTDDAINYILSNAKKLKYNNKPREEAPHRELMPQTSKGKGLEPDGALTKMKDGKVLKV